MFSKLASPIDVLKQQDYRNRSFHRPRAMEMLEPRRLFTAGDLDPSFGQGGYVINYDDITGGEIRDVAVQSDGKTVALVYSYGLGETFFVERYNRDGTLDTTFRGDGRTTFSFGGADPFFAVALELSGSKIVIAGSLEDNFGVARLNADGSLDSSFDGDGTRVVAAPNAAPMALGGLAVQSNGKIVLAGAAQKQFAAFRLNANGANDTSFHADGYRQVDMSGSTEMANAVVIQGDGKIVLGGYATGASTNVKGFAVARLTTDGSLDGSFSGDGRKFTQFPNGAASINDLVLQSDGKIVAVGFADGKNPDNGGRVSGVGMVRYSTSGSEDSGFGNIGFVAPTTDGREAMRAVMQGSKIVIATAGPDVFRYTSAGQIDTSFGEDGVSHVPFYSFFWGSGLAAAPDGDLILSGRAAAPELPVPAMARINADGTRDDDFGINGQVVRGGGNVVFPDGEFQDVVVQADGKIVAVVPAGTLESNNQDILVVRYNADGTLDSTFGEQGRVTIDLGGNETGAAIALQGGKLIVGVYSDTSATLVRLNGNGSLDHSFSGDGKQGVVALTGGATLVVASDQKIVLAGKSNGLAHPATTTFVRYNADGSLDTSFGPSGNGQMSFAGEWSADFGVQSDGRIVALLYADDTLNNARRLIRIAASGGGVDGTFKSGEAQLNLNEYTGLPGFARLAVTAQDKIVVAVTRDARGDADLRDVWVFRLNADGSRDQTFASTGGPVFQAPSENLWVTDVAVQSDGKVLVVTGRSPKNAPGPLIDTMKWALHRVEAGGERDATFGDNGTVLAGDGVYRIGHDAQLALMPNGDAVVATYMPNPSYIYRRTALARYQAGALSPNLPGVTLNAGVLLFQGSEGDDQASLWDDGTGGIVLWLDGQTQTFNKADVQRIELFGNGGNDLLKLNPSLNVIAQLMGGAGNDKLIGGAANDTLYGGAGDDHISGNGGNDFIDGQLGADTMLGGAGKDTASYADRTANLIVGLDAFTDDGEAGENDLAYLDIERVEGGFGNDRIGGSGANNELYGYDGNDTISGGGGADALFGAAGNDKMDGGDGSDYLEGGAGHDTLYGGTGGDTLMGLAGNDRLLSDGDGEKDTVRGNDGTDSGDFDELDDVSGVEIVL